MARQRCWRDNWVLDLDIKSFFDTIDWELLLRAVRRHTDCPWVLLYIERWLKAPVCMPDGSVEERTQGMPQGGVISPLLADLCLHEAFDRWMAEQHPAIPFERYADDIRCHCVSEAQARALKEALGPRLLPCQLERHPYKTKIVYCTDANRGAAILSIASTFGATHFARVRRRIVRDSYSSVSLPQGARKRPKGSSSECVAGGCIIATIWPWKRSPAGPDRC